MLVDEVRIKIRGGDGGKGAVAFNKNMMERGPAGGSGGKGGGVIFEGVADVDALKQFRYKKSIQAPHGKDGRSQFKDGVDGEDVTLRVPVGTVIHFLGQHESKEITRIGEQIKVAEGGKGGKGNLQFKSSRNTTPKQSQPGLPGEKTKLLLELKLIADVGLIGFPNVGKSSLLNTLTNAKSKVANYKFTTLEPHLGAWQELILADIPGLIEGASEGKGLGAKFLRHIERTRVLFHLISVESEDPYKDYQTIRSELKSHSPELAEKKEYVLFSKSDNVDKKDMEEKIKALKAKKLAPLPVSILEDESIKKVEKILYSVQKEKTKI